MKIFVLGCGSIGKRHIENLKKLGFSDIVAYDPNEEKRKETAKRFNIEVFDKFEDGLDKYPNAVIIASPTICHLEQLNVVFMGAHVFMEKPISHELSSEVGSFIERCELYNYKFQVGYNLRFHPELIKIKKILDKGEIGNIISVRAQYGSYLPDWHPQEDYRKGYSASEELGGGIILDASHEIDYLRWLFGEVKEVFAFTDKKSSLEIDTEDIAEILLRFESGVIGEIHLDYIQKEKKRDLQIIGDKKTLYCDINKENGFDFNDTYIDEMKHFVECIENNKKPCPDAVDGKKALEIAMAVKRSAKEKRLIAL